MTRTLQMKNGAQPAKTRAPFPKVDLDRGRGHLLAFYHYAVSRGT